MDFKVFKILSNAIEAKNSFGDDFLNAMSQYQEEGKINTDELKKLMDCLCNIDESRDMLADSIKKLVHYIINNKQSIDSLIELLNQFNDFYEGAEFQANFISNVYGSIISDVITLETALKNLKES